VVVSETSIGVRKADQSGQRTQGAVEHGRQAVICRAVRPMIKRCVMRENMARHGAGEGRQIPKTPPKSETTMRIESEACRISRPPSFRSAKMAVC